MATPRPHRRNFNDPGHAQVLTFSCYRGFTFLQADRTCRWLGEAIAQGGTAFDFDFWAYVFMPDHAHLIVHPRQHKYEIAQIRQAIKEPPARKAIAAL